MPKNEEGEFELVLGNKQLLSVFFIVVVLLGVFFTMGYIVGRNSPLSTAEAPPADKKESKPMVIDSGQPAKDTSAKEQAPAEAKTESPAPVPAQTAPQQPAESKPAEQAAAKPERPNPEPLKEKPAPSKPKPEPATHAEDHPSGTYLQLAATTQREADIEVDVLRHKGFRAMAAEIPEKPGLFRVLVGPVPESGVNKMKTDLQNAGFPGDKAIRKTF